MKTLPLRFALLGGAAILAVAAAFSSVAAAPFVAPETVETAWQAQEATETDVVPVAVWTLVGMGLMVVVGGTLYMLKRRVGGFPEHPSWVAPISVMPSREFPDEGDYGDQVPSDQAHAEH